MSRWKVLAAIGGMAVALVATPATPAAAAAYPTAYNTKTQYLTSAPEDHMPMSCVERRLFLAEGSYDWHQHLQDYAKLIRSGFQLGEGWYNLKDCFDPGTGIYYHTTWLTPENPSWEQVHTNRKIWLTKGGNITWGSSLTPLF
ncbi:hypothetical protein [Actinomadura sp. 9N407]|uniref:hypothetical protein n=1 Tax=Actinomadura sp. 9N407 TaxID=3375154 RepID=UPI00379BA07C